MFILDKDNQIAYEVAAHMLLPEAKTDGLRSELVNVPAKDQPLKPNIFKDERQEIKKRAKRDDLLVLPADKAKYKAAVRIVRSIRT